MELPFRALRKERVGRVGRRGEEGMGWGFLVTWLDLIVCITWGLPLYHIQAVDVLLGPKWNQRPRVSE